MRSTLVVRAEERAGSVMEALESRRLLSDGTGVIAENEQAPDLELFVADDVVSSLERTQLALFVFGAATPTHPPTIAASVQLPDWKRFINFNFGEGSAPYYVHPKVEERGYIGWNSAAVSIRVPRPQPQPVLEGLGSWGAGIGSGSHALFKFGTRITEPPARSGVVKFMKEGVVVAEVPVDADGNAYYTAQTISLGEHEFTAEYSGDSNYAASSASAVKVVVNKTQTKASLTGTRMVMNQGDWVRLQINVSTATKDFVRPGGWVMLMAGERKLVKLRLGAKMKVLDLDLVVGVHRIRAIYLGDENCEGSESKVFKLRVKAGR